MTEWRIQRHPLVERDIRRIALYLLDYATPERVGQIIQQLDHDVDALRVNPYRGTRRDGILPGLRAIPSARKGVIAFQIFEDRRLIRLLAVAWGGGNWQGWLNERSDFSE